MPFSNHFKKLLSSVEETYLGEKVPKKYRQRYGKIYNKKDIEPLSRAIATSKGIKVEL